MNIFNNNTNKLVHNSYTVVLLKNNTKKYKVPFESIKAMDYK